MLDNLHKIKGKLTLNNERAYVVIKHQGKLITRKWIGTEEQYSTTVPTEKTCGTKESPEFFGRQHIPKTLH